jgi:hypothetical protein
LLLEEALTEEERMVRDSARRLLAGTGQGELHHRSARSNAVNGRSLCREDEALRDHQQPDGDALLSQCGVLTTKLAAGGSGIMPERAMLV